MLVDQYAHDFRFLVDADLPKHMEELKRSIEKPMPMTEFAIDGVGVVGLCKSVGLKNDFPGCYLLLKNKEPIYTGISKKVLQRLRQHVRGTTHFDASLAYRMASDKMPHNHTRSTAMEQGEFKEQFSAAKEYLRNLDVAYVKIINPLSLYVFEPYCAMEFGTGEWNTFETH